MVENKRGRPRTYPKRAECSLCGIEYETYHGKPKGKNNFCGNACRGKWLGEQNRLKRVNQKGGLTEAEKLKIRKAHLGKGQKKAYQKYLGRHTHRVEAEKKLGRLLREGEVVHHIDGDIHNNSQGNLYVFGNQSEHAKWHAQN